MITVNFRIVNSNNVNKNDPLIVHPNNMGDLMSKVTGQFMLPS